MKKAREEKLITRAAELPVIDCEEMTWEELEAAATHAWTESTALANWAASELRRHDVQRTPDMERLPPMEPIYLYGLAGEGYGRWGEWRGAYTCANSVLRDVNRRYRAMRFDIVWRGNASTPSFGYPYPYPVHNQSWTCRVGEDGRPRVSLPLGGRRVTLVLRGGPEWRRQMRLFNLLASREAKRGEAYLLGKSIGGRDGRVVVGRDATGCHRERVRLFVKLVGSVKPSEAPPAERTLYLTTDPAAFWVATVDERQVWILNGDHIASCERLREWVEEADTLRQRRREDLKHERRWPARVRRQMHAALARKAEKDRNRIDTFVDQACAMAAGFARRQRCAEVVYHDPPGGRGFLPHFPWHRLRNQLGVALQGDGTARRWPVRLTILEGPLAA